MKKTLTYLCAGRRVFLGQNLYANGACLLGIHSIELMDEGMILMDGADMVYHTVGVVTTEAGKPQYVPITSIGREWYNTHGSVDIILDKSQRVVSFTIIRKRMKLREPPVISKDFRNDRQRQQESVLKSALLRRQRE